jgi:hypothetical protein
MGPRLFGVCEDHPDVNTTRTLMLVAKVIQKIANLARFVDQEEYMKPLNGIIEENIPNMKKFIDEISVRYYYG